MFFRFLFGILFLAHVLFAQQAEPAKKTAVTLQISDISGMIKINPLYGTIFSLKHHFSSFFAVRIGFDLTYTDYHIQSSLTDTLGNTNKSKNYEYRKGLGANLDFLFYVKNSSRIKFYLGGGPGVFFSKIKEFPQKGEFKLYQFHFLAGVEWHVTQNFSIGLENGLQFEKKIYQWRFDEVWQQGNQDIQQKRWKKQEYKGISSLPINLILNLYF